MWYHNSNGVDTNIPTAQLSSYSYWGEEDEGESCGTYWFYEGVDIVADRWYTLEMCVKMNDEGECIHRPLCTVELVTGVASPVAALLPVLLEVAVAPTFTMNNVQTLFNPMRDRNCGVGRKYDTPRFVLDGCGNASACQRLSASRATRVWGSIL